MPPFYKFSVLSRKFEDMYVIRSENLVCTLKYYFFVILRKIHYQNCNKKQKYGYTGFFGASNTPEIFWPLMHKVLWLFFSLGEESTAPFWSEGKGWITRTPTESGGEPPYSQLLILPGMIKETFNYPPTPPNATKGKTSKFFVYLPTFQKFISRARYGK